MGDALFVLGGRGLLLEVLLDRLDPDRQEACRGVDEEVLLVGALQFALDLDIRLDTELYVLPRCIVGARGREAYPPAIGRPAPPPVFTPMIRT